MPTYKLQGGPLGGMTVSANMAPVLMFPVLDPSPATKSPWSIDPDDVVLENGRCVVGKPIRHVEYVVQGPGEQETAVYREIA